MNDAHYKVVNLIGEVKQIIQANEDCQEKYTV